MDSSQPSGVAGPEILIVEDSLTQAEQLRFVLEERGFVVRHGRNGVEALALLGSHLPLAVISDINMPEMDGYALCRRIRSDPTLAGLPTLLLTSLSDPEDVMRALECGADYFFTKPLNDELLLQRLRYIQENHAPHSPPPDSSPIAVRIGGHLHHIASSPLRVLNLLFSTYESAVAQNHRLQRVEAELRQLNENLEVLVQERTAELRQTNQTLQAENAARRAVEQRLREQAELIDKASEAIITTDIDNRIRFLNPAAERLLGWSVGEMEGRPIGGVIILGGVGHGPGAGSAQPTSGDWRGEAHGHNRKGEPLVLETSVTVLRDEAGRPMGRLYMSADIAEKKKLEQRVLRAQRLESIGMLATGIAHDLNNVLAPIGMASTLLRSHLSEKGDVRMLDILEQSATRGTALVRQVLGFAHGIGGEPRVVQVKHLLRDITAMITATFPKSIILDEQVPGDLWPINGNPTLIHQVLLNLCVNARDAMPEGGTLSLRAENCLLDATAAQAIEHARPGAWVVLQVADTGTGIPPEVLSRIWEPFFTTKGAAEGTGLGLATVRGIVETHQGFITLRTVLGQGTTFRISLPAATAEGPTGTGTGTAAAMGAGCGQLILVVDDEASIRETICEILRIAGYQTVTAIDGAEAAGLILTRGAEFSLVITDHDMPHLDGTGLARIIRAHQPTMKILAISGLEVPRRVTGSNGESICDARLAKPFRVDTLLGAVELQLRGKTAAG